MRSELEPSSMVEHREWSFVTGVVAEEVLSQHPLYALCILIIPATIQHGAMVTFPIILECHGDLP